jgi:hypothetical protein
MVRCYGLRELAVGTGILCAKRDAAPWLWARVAGDAPDLATLVAATTGRNPRRGSATLALAAVAGVTALDVIRAQELGRRGPDRCVTMQIGADCLSLPRRCAVSPATAPCRPIRGCHSCSAPTTYPADRG